MRTGKRPRPSYKRLYEALLSTLSQTETPYESECDERPTHEVVVYDTIEWRFKIKADSDELAEEFSFGDEQEGITLVGMQKSTYNTGHECYRYDPNTKRTSSIPRDD